MSRTITLSVPDRMYEAMQAFPEINYSELARERIAGYLASVKNREEFAPYGFLVLKDLIFAPEKIVEIHNKIEKNTEKMGILHWVSGVFELNLLASMANFMHRFAKEHPFKDGNKRTAFVCVDSFLRLNRFRLKIKTNENRTTEDEKFFWQNANQQKKPEQIKEFLQKHLVPAKKPMSAEQAVNESIKENRVLLKNLSAE